MVADKIKAALAKRKITIYKLSRLTGITYELLRRSLSGSRKMSAEELLLIIERVGIGIEELK